VVLDGLLPMTAIMRAVRRFTELGAPTKLQLLVEFLSGVPERFEETGADAMVALDVALAPDRGGRALPPVEMTLLAHRDHPLHREPSPRTRAQLARHVELTVADSGRAAPNAPPVPLGSPHVFRLPDFHAKREALLSGIGYGFLPHHLARSLLDDATLLPLGFEEGDHHVFSPRLVTSPRRGLGQAAQAFVTHLQEELGAGAATWSGPATWSDPP
jgi:DNA-binding transcriptional LysR family regulator